MDITNQVTEFFQSVYEATRGEIPEFLKHAHEFDVRYALRNLDAPDTASILAKEDAFRVKTQTLRAAYYQTVGLVQQLPDELKVAGLHIASQQLPATMDELGSSDQVKATALAELGEILASHPAPTTQHLQQVMDIIEQANG